MAFSVLRHQQDAEDLAQEALVKGYRHFHRLRDRERFRSWIVRMAWRTALDRQRANRRRSAHETTVDGSVLRCVAPPSSSDAQDARAVMRSYRSANTLVLRDGQTRQFTAATDRVNGEVIRSDVTLRVVK